MGKIAIIDYGSGNVRSVWNALKKISPPETEIVLTSDAAEIKGSDRILVPGVGAYEGCMNKLKSRGLIQAIIEFSKAGRPVLGICCGMQILSEVGEENGISTGLSLIKGRVKKLAPASAERLPHIGWSSLFETKSSLFEGLKPEHKFYFVHSYHFETDDPSHIVAKAHYGQDFAAAVQHNNLAGFQFHPEKSDAAGLRLLYNFCSWNP